MPGAVMHLGKWRIKPSGKLPIFLRFVINSSFTLENAGKIELKNTLPNRTYLNHMMYWPAEEYNKFEAEVISHMKTGFRWFNKYYRQQLKKSESLYKKGLLFKKIDWTKKSNQEIRKILEELIAQYGELMSAWYCQYPLDEYFEAAIGKKLLEYIAADNKDFRKFVLIFTDPRAMTEVSEERWKLAKLAKEFFMEHENLDSLSLKARKKLQEHLDTFAYINRGLATSKPYTFRDMVLRLNEIKKQLSKGESIDPLIYLASLKKIKDDYSWALKKIRPKSDFLKVIQKARDHTYLRNRRVEAFFNADYGASFMYFEIARRSHFNPEWIMEISVPEMFGSLLGKPLPDKNEMRMRLKNYAMTIRNAKTQLIIDREKIKKLEKVYREDVALVKEIRGNIACLGGIIQGRAKVCLDKKEIGKVKRGDILIAQFTTPDFVPAMEKASAIVADQGGLSSHAAIVSRELGVPCIIATQNGTRIIHDNDLLQVDATKGTVKILQRA